MLWTCVFAVNGGERKILESVEGFDRGLAAMKRAGQTRSSQFLFWGVWEPWRAARMSRMKESV